MSSQKSTAATTLVASALEPKRQRGYARVAAITDAAAAIFAERGYDAATMTEIAARSNTAIGSLYRFFPTKEALADALLARYGARMSAGLAAIEREAPQLSTQAVADALVDLMLDMARDRALAVTLVDARADGSGRRSAMRTATSERIGAILRAFPGKAAERRREAAITMLLNLVKTVPPLAATQVPGALDELRRLIALYLDDLVRARP